MSWFYQLMAARFTRQRSRGQAAAPLSFFSQDQELRDHRLNRSCMLQAVADSPRHRKLVLPESTLWHSTRTVDLSGIRKASDKPSDNGSRQRRTQHDAVRHRNPSGLG